MSKQLDRYRHAAENMGVSHFIELPHLTVQEQIDQLADTKMHYEGWSFDSTVILVNSAVVTNYSQDFLRYPICFIRSRLKKESFARRVTMPAPGLCLVYMGPFALKFQKMFTKFGTVLLPYSK